MSPNAARLAVRTGKPNVWAVAVGDPARCTLPFALNVAKRQKCLLSPVKADRSIAAIVSTSSEITAAKHSFNLNINRLVRLISRQPVNFWQIVY